MQSRSRFPFTLASLATLFLAQPAVADPGDLHRSALGSPSRLVLERDLERAMAQMDRNLSALLGSRTMDCAGEDGFGGVETCWVSLESLQAADAPHGPARH